MNDKRSRLLAIRSRLILPVVILILAALIYGVLVRSASKQEPLKRSAPPVQVAVFKASQVLVQRQWRGFGTVEAVDKADVPARVTATVVQIAESILSGMPVTAGQLLVQLDDSDFQRQVEIAQQRQVDLEAQLAQIEVERQCLADRLELERDDVRLVGDELRRLEALLERGAANQQDVDAAKRLLNASQRTRLLTAETFEKLGPGQNRVEAQRAAQRATVRLAQQDLARCTILSPIDGFLQEVDVEVGEEVRPGLRVARVVNLDRVEVVLRLPAAARRTIAIHDEVELHATNQMGLTWNVHVSRIGPEDDVATRTVTLYMEVVQAEAMKGFGRSAGMRLLTPGTFVTGLLTSARSERRWVVPRRSIRGGRILLVDNGVIQSGRVKVDFAHEGEQQQLGLRDDQWAVLAGNPSCLRDGALVLVNYLASVSVGQHVEAVLRRFEDRQEAAAAKGLREAVP